jgi:N4-(beta-N-acetylglucosaminyl)-L-asparaginase
MGSANALAGMRQAWDVFLSGGDPLDAALAVVKVVEADPNDHSVGLGGLPNEDGVVQLDAACMYGPTHHSGAVACIENILHPSEVARAVLERTDHCLLVGRGAYEFARAHGHAHVELLTEEARALWLKWREAMSSEDDWLPPAQAEQHGSLGPAPLSREEARRWRTDPSLPPHHPRHGTVHCSALSARGELACCTTTSGLPFKIPGRVGDSPLVGAGLYCDQEAGSAGATGRGEASILANASFVLVELMRQGAPPLEAAHELLRRVVRQTERQAKWQAALLGPDGMPSFNLHVYVLSKDGRTAGAALHGAGQYAVADAERGARLEPLVPLLT